jgi:hypothetical protein
LSILLAWTRICTRKIDNLIPAEEPGLLPLGLSGALRRANFHPGNDSTASRLQAKQRFCDNERGRVSPDCHAGFDNL